MNTVPENDYRMMKQRAEAAEARAADLEARLDVMRDKYIAQVVATDNMVKENTKLRAELERVRSESLERFNSVCQENTLDSDTAAWLLEVAKRLEQPQ